MSSVNKVILVGRLGKDPETRHLQNGGMIASVSLATSENWKDKQGQKQERTEWHRVIFFGKLAEIVDQCVTKGSMIYVEGSLCTRSWEDQQGQKRYSTEIKASSMQMLGGGESRPEGQQPAHTRPSKQYYKEFYAPQDEPTQSPMGADDWSDSIPF